MASESDRDCSDMPDDLDACLFYELCRSSPAISDGVKEWRRKARNLAKLKTEILIRQFGPIPDEWKRLSGYSKPKAVTQSGLEKLWQRVDPLEGLKPASLRRIDCNYRDLLDHLVCFPEFPDKSWNELPDSVLKRMFIESSNVLAGRGSLTSRFTKVIKKRKRKKIGEVEISVEGKKAVPLGDLIRFAEEETLPFWEITEFVRSGKIDLSDELKIPQRLPRIGVVVWKVSIGNEQLERVFKFSWILRDRQLAEKVAEAFKLEDDRMKHREMQAFLRWTLKNRPKKFPEKKQSCVWLGRETLPYEKRALLADLAIYRLKSENKWAVMTLLVEPKLSKFSGQEREKLEHKVMCDLKRRNRRAKQVIARFERGHSP